MDKQPIPEWAKQGMKIFTAVIILACALPGWVDAVLAWRLAL